MSSTWRRWSYKGALKLAVILALGNVALQLLSPSTIFRTGLQQQASEGGVGAAVQFGGGFFFSNLIGILVLCVLITAILNGLAKLFRWLPKGSS